MEYLHQQSEPPVVHCDLKPSNVLLDTDLVAHVGDFGLAKLLQLSDTGSVSDDQSSSFAVKGTVGYVHQNTEWEAMHRPKEMRTALGKRPTDDIFKDGVNLHTLCSSALSNSNITDIVDSHLLQELNVDVLSEKDDFVAGGNMLQCIVSLTSVGVACTVESPNAPMDMGCALKNLYNIKKKLFPSGVVSEQPNLYLQYTLV